MLAIALGLASACGGEEVTLPPLDAINVGCATDDKELVARSIAAAEAAGEQLPSTVTELGAMAEAGEDELFAKRCDQLLALYGESDVPELSAAEVLTGLTETLAPSIMGPDEPVDPQSTAGCAARALLDHMISDKGVDGAIATLQGPASQGVSGFESDDDQRVWWAGYYDCAGPESRYGLILSELVDLVDVRDLSPEEVDCLTSMIPGDLAVDAIPRFGDGSDELDNALINAHETCVP